MYQPYTTWVYAYHLALLEEPLPFLYWLRNPGDLQNYLKNFKIDMN